MDRVKEFIKKDFSPTLSFNFEKKKERWGEYIVYEVTVNKAGNFGTPIFVLEDENGGLRYCTNEEVYDILYFFNKDEEK